MLEIIDKLIIFIFCSILYMQGLNIGNIPVPMLIVLTLSCLCTYFENKKIIPVLSIIFAFLCIYFLNLIIFLPVMLYDLFYNEDWKFSLIYLVPIIPAVLKYEPMTIGIVVLFISVAYFLKYKTSKINKLLLEYHTYRDNSKELEILLVDRNHRILENQDYEIHLATLNERNRISKEIHDNIGHLISRSLIHIGALLTISKEIDTKKGLTLLKDSLSEGMDSIRSSIHNIHNESIDLFSSIDTLVKDFDFCPISFDYNIRTTPPLNLKYFFIWTVKEALANCMKHSNGTNITIILTEHPIMYQLIIMDNGLLTNSTLKKIKELNQSYGKIDGIGLRNMAERVQGLEGIIRFSGENGFKIFITIPIKNRNGEEAK